ncbi:adenylate/guanylate cyclase domain-containing protein [Hanstruepera flava]|uniref:adenylate/guanylate cyclase domain-containing protein n=1 Tax=Hanstruepera flava TaxID=2930218 RepID=UPI0020278565|nr:adenylate/guanylate cyclase domain-containing protein [Hanstruepera flava]
MENLEQDILNTFNEFWHMWAKRAKGEATIHDLKQYFDPEVSSIGTGEHEIGKDLETVIENFSYDLKELQKPFKLDVFYEKAKVLSPTSGVVEAEANVEIDLDADEPLKLHIRFSTVFILKDGNWLIKHNHVSFPSKDQGVGESYPLDALTAQNNRLQALVEQRTYELEEKTTLLEKEKDKTEKLLFNILPRKIARELLDNGYSVPVRHENVSVIFTDFVEFTKIASQITARELVEELNDIFFHFDSLIKEQELEKIKTIGDSYMAVCGLPEPHNEHAFRCIVVARKMLSFIEDRNNKRPIKWQMRIGIHSGPVVAGIVGNDKFAYDLWGRTVNLASRLESAGIEGKINISEDTYHLIKESIPCEYRGKQLIKGNKEVDMYFVN